MEHLKIQFLSYQFCLSSYDIPIALYKKTRREKIISQSAEFFSTANMSINEFKNRSVNDENLFTQEEILDLAKIISNDQSVRVLDYHLVDCSKETGGFMSSRTSLKVTFQVIPTFIFT